MVGISVLRTDYPTISHNVRRFLGATPLDQHIGAALVAAAFAIYLTAPAVNSLALPVALGLLFTGVLFLKKALPPKPVLLCIGVILAFTWLAIPVSYIRQEGQFEHTAWFAVLTTVLVPLVAIRGAKIVLWWLTPIWLLQAGACLFQWLQGDAQRVMGIAGNQNPGAQFLLLGCIFLINGDNRVRWLILPLVAALPFTGARWVGVVAAVVLVGIFAYRVAPWKYIAPGIIIALVLVSLIGWDDVMGALYRPSTLSIHIGGYPGQLDYNPSWMPRGFYDSGIHIAPWRMMHETGIASGLAWLVATGWAIWKWGHQRTEFWLLVTIGLLSVMYADVWVGPLGGFWWLLLNPQPLTKPRDIHAP